MAISLIHLRWGKSIPKQEQIPQTALPDDGPLVENKYTQKLKYKCIRVHYVQMLRHPKSDERCWLPRQNIQDAPNVIPVPPTRDYSQSTPGAQAQGAAQQELVEVPPSPEKKARMDMNLAYVEATGCDVSTALCSAGEKRYTKGAKQLHAVGVEDSLLGEVESLQEAEEAEWVSSISTELNGVAGKKWPLPQAVRARKYRWVDTMRLGWYKSRLTCQDLGVHSWHPEERIHCPTPSPLTNAAMEFVASWLEYDMVALDIVVCFSLHPCQRQQRTDLYASPPRVERA
eukprot:450460-Amphidinium_carterae.1